MSMGAWAVWMEGYVAQGNTACATLLGTYRAGTFREAVTVAVREHFGSDPNFDLYWRPDEMTFWGCHFFDNESDARKSFG